MIGTNTIANAQAEAQKAAEGGTQTGIAESFFMDGITSIMNQQSSLILDKDGKMLAFYNGGGALSLSPCLERIKRYK